MAGRRRRGPNSKSLRVSQEQHQQQNRSYDSSRLKPEQVGSLVHDESDTISYRSYLLQNFIASSELIDVLTIQPIPMTKIKPPPVYRGINIEEFRQTLAKEKEQLEELTRSVDSYEFKLSDNFKFLKESCRSLTEDELDDERLNSIAAGYSSKFHKEVKDDRIVIHKDKFLDLRGDTSEAPANYWEKHREMVAKKKEEALKLKLLQEEEARKLQEEADRKMREEEEQRLFEEQFQQQIQPPLADQPVTGEETQVDQQAPSGQPQERVPPQVEENPQSGMLGSIFGEINGDTFNNDFEDEFADLDTAFF
ncbi:LAFE_0D04940g1_1 [Lachancea fermentati]|uniref:LAFE_0D04940g1_1 n=1 Tax=Lachancea fermentati TaxID=4955 RepID=A0A1G4MB92_LACFM|nr:LAFE_0D04940g1_1 [Lachancea fermentati]